MMTCRLFGLYVLCSIFNTIAIDHYYCVPADTKYFALVKNFIGSIHHNDFEHLKEIAVFDLGFTTQQVAELRRMQRVKVYNVEMTHPDLLKPMVTSPQGRQVRGFFAWKPVIIKQALEMFPYVLYMDAGTAVLKPLDDLFEYINEHGYFFVSADYQETNKLGNRITKPVCDKIVSKFSKNEQDVLLMQAYHLHAGCQGLSRQMLQSYVLPVYEHTRDMSLFADDGTAKFGYGAGRHDQTLFTIYAYHLGLKIHPMGISMLNIREIITPIDVVCNKAMLNSQTMVYLSQAAFFLNGGTTQFVKYNK